VVEHLGVVAPGALRRTGEIRQAVECPLRIDRDRATAVGVGRDRSAVIGRKGFEDQPVPTSTQRG
jgi:hypothetical protein